MDAELVTWILIFAGGYLAVLAILFWIALSRAPRN